MKQNSDLYQKMLNGLPVGVIGQNEEGAIVFANTRAGQILDTPQEILLNTSLFTFANKWLDLNGNPLQETDTPFYKTKTTKEPIAETIIGVDLKGKEDTVWLKLSSSPELNKDGSIRVIVTSFKEIELTEVEKIQSLNFELNSIVELLPDIILKVDEENRFIYGHSNNPDELILPIDSFLGKKFNEVLPENLHSIFSENVQKVRENRKLVVFEYQLKLDEKIELWFEARLIISANNEIILIIRNITEQKLVEQEFHLEKQLLETTIKSLPGIFYLYNEKGEFLKWNENFERVTGYSNAEMQKLHPLDLFDDDEKELLTQKIASVFETGEDSVEANFLLKDGSKIPYYFTGAALEYNGEMCLLGVGIDISDQKKAEESQRTSEKRFRGLVEHSSSGMAILSPTTEIMYISPTLRRILGYTEDEFVGFSKERSLIHPDDLLLIQEQFQKVIEGKRKSTTSFTVRIKDKEGRWRWIESILTNMIENPAINGVVSNFRDVTEQVHAEEKLQKALQELQTHLLNTPLGVVEYNQDLVITKWSKKCEDIFGWTSSEVLGKNISGFDFIYDEDLDKAKNTSKLLLSSKVSGNISTNRNYTKDGRVIDCIWYNSVMKDDEGKVTSIMSLVEDITAAKKAELEIVKNEKRLSHLISNLPGIVYRCRNDENWTMHYISEACYNLLGYKPEELVRNKLLSFNSVIHKDDRDRVRQEAQKALNKNKRYELNYRVVTKSGEVRRVWEKGGAVQNLKNGELVLEGFIQDVTKEYLAQTELEKKDKEKSFLLSEIHHRVKNNLAVVSGLMQLQALGSKDEKIETVLLDSVGRIKSIALIHEHLYTSDDFSRIRFDENIKKLVQNIEYVMRSGKNIVTSYNLEPVELDINQAVPCALLINEIVTNTYKHAFSLRDSGEIQISSAEVNGDVTLIIKDNGVGINNDQIGNEESTSLGMKLIEVVTQQLGGKLTIDGSNGTTIKVEFTKQEIIN